MPPEAICTPMPERLPEGNLGGQGVHIAEGAYFPIHPNPRQCIAILFSRAGQTAKRGEELLARKQQNSSHRTSSDPAAAELKCDRCENKAASVKGLKQHIRRSAHKEISA